MRLRSSAVLLTRRFYLVILVVPGLILLHVLLRTSQNSFTEGYKARFNKANAHSNGAAGINDRVGWDSDYAAAAGNNVSPLNGLPNRDSFPGMGGTKSKSTWKDFGQRIGRLTGVGGNDRAQVLEDSYSAPATQSSRSGGSIYELVAQSIPGLYDARTSIDKLRLTSTRFMSARPPSPYQVFSHTPERQHILVTGGFSSVGKALVRDLLLLGGESGASESDDPSSGRGFGFSDLFRDDDEDVDEYEDEHVNIAKAKELDKKRGIIVTILDTSNKSTELDDMLQHTPLYHRSRIGFNLPDGRGSMGRRPIAQDNIHDAFGQSGPPGSDFDGAPPVEFVDPRSAAFSSSEVSLASFIAKGRLRIVRGDARDVTLLQSLLTSRPVSEPQPVKRQTREKSKFGFLKRPHHETEAVVSLPPVSGVFHLAGYENTDCKMKNPRDCADLEKNGVQALAKALAALKDRNRPWVVAGNRGNLEEPEVAAWLEEEQAEEEPEQFQATNEAGQTGRRIIDEARQSTQAQATTKATKRSLDTVKRRDSAQTASYTGPLASLATKARLHALSLRLPPNSHIIGDSFAPRSLPIPHIIHSAMGHLPITVDEHAFPHMTTGVKGNSTWAEEGDLAMSESKSVWDGTGLIYIDDIVESLVAAGELLARSMSADYVNRLSLVAELDVVPPPRSSVSTFSYSASTKSLAEDVVDWIIQLTKSSSPVGYSRTRSASQVSEVLRGKSLDRGQARKILGTSPQTPLPLALKSYIRSVLGRQTSYLDGQITEACAPPHDLRTLNDALAQLDTCSAQLLGLVSGEHVVLACNPAFTESSVTSPLVLSSAVPYTEKISQVKLKSKWGPVGKVDLGFFCPFGKDGADEQIVWIESTETMEGSWATATEAASLKENNPTIWSYDKLEVNFVRRDMRSFTLSILMYPQASPGAAKRRMVFALDPSKKGQDKTMKDVMTLDFQLLSETRPDWQTMEWRINPICCSERLPSLINGFTFQQEDPLLTSQILYPSMDGSSSVAESTYELQKCRNLRSAHEYSTKLSTWNERTSTLKTCPRSLSEGSDWIVHDLPVCSIDCDAPITCLVNDKCRCTRDRCGDKMSMSPTVQDTLAYSSQLSFQYENKTSHGLSASTKPADDSDITLAKEVEALPWNAVLQPTARHLFSLALSDLPQTHVVPLPADVDTHMLEAACYDMSKSDLPTMGDHLLSKALEIRASDVEEADFAFVPYYQGCYYNYLKENTYKKLADTVAIAETQIVLSDRLRASNIVVPFTHEWGSCTGWWPLVEDVLSRSPPPPMSKAISWQVNGDYNTRCLKSERDVVIPGVSPHTSKLRAIYGDLRSIKRTRDRANLAFFYGKVEGFGAFARTRLGCVAAVQRSDRILYQIFAEGKDYLGTLNESKFCLLPRGVTGWSTETFDAIYAGCIPVFIADRTSLPYSSTLYYSAFSLTIAENQIHNLATVLTSISERQLHTMQVALLKVRDAFLFAQDPADEWHRRGPLYYTLLEMAGKLSLQWPTLPVHNTCKA